MIIVCPLIGVIKEYFQIHCFQTKKTYLRHHDNDRFPPRLLDTPNPKSNNYDRIYVVFLGLQSDTYQEDIYPMTAGTEPALSATEWLSGINRGKQHFRHTGLVDAPLVVYEATH